jgi:inositol oxygenase
VRKFNPYDLYSRSPARPDWEKRRPFYVALIDRHLPQQAALVKRQLPLHVEFPSR